MTFPGNSWRILVFSEANPYATHQVPGRFLSVQTQLPRNVKNRGSTKYKEVVSVPRFYRESTD